MIDSSLLDTNEDTDMLSAVNRIAKWLGYTVWWTTTSTYTKYHSVGSGITFSVSYACSIVGAMFPPVC